MQNDKQRYIHLNGQLIPVSEEVYQEWKRPIWRTYDFARRHGQCACTNWQFCEGECGDCVFRRSGDNRSLESLMETSGMDWAENNSDPLKAVENADSYEELLQQLDEIDPYGRQIAELLLNGTDDRTAASILGLTRAAYSRKKMKLRRELTKRRGNG